MKANQVAWTMTDIAGAKYLGIVEFQDRKGDWHDFEILHSLCTVNSPARIVFGGATNTGFLESGFISQADCESLDETLQELLADLQVYYDDGAQYVTRIICNERM